MTKENQMDDLMQTAKEAGIELDLIDEDEGQIWYITAEGLERFAQLIAKKAVEAAKAEERVNIINLMMIQHEAAAGRHNYWHVAANLIEAESR